MEDILTEIPPPSRFFQEDLSNFTPPSPPLPSPFLLFSNPNPNFPLRPSLLIIALSHSSLHVFNHISSKTLIGGLFLPETPFSGTTIKPSLRDKSCNIYALNESNSETLLVSVQCSVTADRSNLLAKLLIGGDIVPESVIIFDSVQSPNFRGKLAPGDTCAFKLETSAERKLQADGFDRLLNGLEYFPSGSVVDGLPAAILARCEMRNIRGALCVSWPEYGGSVVGLIKGLVEKSVLQGVEFSGDEAEAQLVWSGRSRSHAFESELYT